MPRRTTNFQKGHYYHIYNRGANKTRIFRERQNYLYLLERIRKYSKTFNISIIAYCLMPNHYHFLLKQKGDEGIPKFMQSVFNSYSKAFNRKYNRSGTLFEGRFKDSHINNRRYLIHLCAYIHRNAVEAGLSDKLGQWPYSNLPEWLNLRNGNLFNNKFRDEHFTTEQAYLSFLKGYAAPEGLEKYLF